MIAIRCPGVTLNNTEPRLLEEGYYGDPVFVRCRHGYLSNIGQFDDIAVCQANGTWSGMLSCQRKVITILNQYKIM